MELVKI